MAQKTNWDDAPLTESDINTYLMGEGGAWSSWTPTVTQSGAVSVTVDYGRFARYGRTIVAECRLAVTGSGTGSNLITLSLPATAATSNDLPIGDGWIKDTSDSRDYRGQARLATASTVYFVDTFVAPAFTFTGGASMGSGANTMSAGLASGDTIGCRLVYEAAT